MNRRITSARFSEMFCSVMEHYGIKTVGQAKKFLDKLPFPNTKLCYGTTHTRAVHLRKELSAFLTA